MESQMAKLNITKTEQVSQENMDKAIASSKFEKVVSEVDTSVVEVHRTTIRDVKMFGKATVGFVVSEWDYINLKAPGEPKIIQGYHVARGGSVAVLTIIKTPKRRVFIGIKQLKTGVWKVIEETPAGMINEETGDVAGVAVSEIEEETGIKINKKDLTKLGSFYNSAGLLDEETTLYSFEIKKSEKALKAMLEKMYGLAEENEFISLFAIDENDENAIFATKDPKFIIAYSMWKSTKAVQEATKATKATKSANKE